VEEKLVFESLPSVDAGNDVSFLSAVTNHMQWQTAVGHCRGINKL
jgi:hypothetical protein